MRTAQTNSTSSSDVIDYNADEASYFMKQALHVAKAALDIGEVPVGSVIVLRDGTNEVNAANDSSINPNNQATTFEKQSNHEFNYNTSPSVIISHGANQVNATRDATRHAEIVAMDRMLTGSRSSDQLRLPRDVILKSAHGKVPENYSSDHDHWVNMPREKDHWKNKFGWGSGRIYDGKVLERCDLYVTCEPCIMVSKLCSISSYESMLHNQS